MIIQMLRIFLPLCVGPLAGCAIAQSQAQDTVDSIFAEGQVWELADFSGTVFTLTVPSLDTKLSFRPYYQGAVTLNNVPSFVRFTYDPHKVDTGLITVSASAVNLSQIFFCYVRNPGEIHLHKALKGISVNNFEDISGPEEYINTGAQGNYENCTLRRLQ